jgi:hypothetical protein
MAFTIATAAWLTVMLLTYRVVYRPLTQRRLERTIVSTTGTVTAALPTTPGQDHRQHGGAGLTSLRYTGA